jgi:hypothetical protein
LSESLSEPLNDYKRPVLSFSLKSFFFTLVLLVSLLYIAEILAPRTRGFYFVTLEQASPLFTRLPSGLVYRDFLRAEPRRRLPVPPQIVAAAPRRHIPVPPQIVAAAPRRRLPVPLYRNYGPRDYRRPMGASPGA